VLQGEESPSSDPGGERKRKHPVSLSKRKRRGEQRSTVVVETAYAGN